MPARHAILQPEELQLLLTTCRSFADTVIRPFVESDRESLEHRPLHARDARAISAGLDGLGLRTLAMADADGGQPLDHATRIRCIEELARVEGGVALSLAHDWAATAMIADLGADVAAETWLGRYRAEPTFRFVVDEEQLADAVLGPGTYPTDAPALLVTTTSEGPMVSGRIVGVPDAAGASAFVVAAVDPDRPERPLLAIVPADAGGLRVHVADERIGLDLSHEADLSLDEVLLTDERILSTGPRSASAIRDLVTANALSEAATAVGIAQASYDAATAHASERVQGGRTIARYGAMAAMLGKMATAVAVARAMTRSAADAVDGGRVDAAPLAIMAALQATEAANEVTLRGMEVHGGSGVMREMGLEKLYRDAVELRNRHDRDARWMAIARADVPIAAQGIALGVLEVQPG